jgi:hypothetical protein
MNPEFKQFVIDSNRKKLQLNDDATYAKFYHLTSTKNVKNIFKRGFNEGTFFAVNESDVNIYKRQVIKPYLMVCFISLDGVVPLGDYFLNQERLILGRDNIWRPISDIKNGE